MKYLIEHLEAELHEWSILEYAHMLSKLGRDSELIITNIPVTTTIDKRLEGATITSMTVREYLQERPAILLDQCAESMLHHSDHHLAEYIICGGILGTDEFDGPMVDRTAEIRQTGEWICRHLGDKQMTADTAVIVSKMVLEDQVEIGDMKFIDRPSIKIAKREWVEMPFRYLATAGDDYQDTPILPPGMVEHLRE
eukprot:Partr_v1_DN24967_c0_g1_i1_m45178 putative DUF431 domain-containing protein